MKRVLIVDDTKNIRILLTTCLEVEGYQVVSAIDGKKALELLEEERFDLIFLDIKLPEISGTDVLKKIRELGNTTPVIIMTAFGTVKNAIECTKLGAVVYLQKPFSPEKLRNVLNEVKEYLGDRLQDINIFLNNSRELIGQAKYDEAYKQLKQALATNPNCGATYQLLAQLYEIKGEKEAAERFKTIARQFND